MTVIDTFKLSFGHTNTPIKMQAKTIDPHPASTLLSHVNLVTELKLFDDDGKTINRFHTKKHSHIDSVLRSTRCTMHCEYILLRVRAKTRFMHFTSCFVINAKFQYAFLHSCLCVDCSVQCCARGRPIYLVCCLSERVPTPFYIYSAIHTELQLFEPFFIFPPQIRHFLFQFAQLSLLFSSCIQITIEMCIVVRSGDDGTSVIRST